MQIVDFTVGTDEPAQAADLSQFDPGRIIDDSIFFNGNAMTPRQVQDFLESKLSRCSSGYTCLRDYRENTVNKPADPMCTGYRATAYESAADIIAKVGQACGISQKAIIVTLQKEQGLITSSSPSSGIYRKAMGMGCPDTADCDSAYYGFFNQVYEGARALKRYTHPAGTGPGTEYSTRFDLMYPVGKTSEILYNPNRACGTRSVYVANQATHALYVYTPYTPNASALSAGYGVGDGCGAYGNRNFFNYFSDWFGSPRGAEVASVFTQYYAANQNWLGFPIGGLDCSSGRGGCWQAFQGGGVYTSPVGGIKGVKNGYMAAWGNYGRELGDLVYPISDETCGMGEGACRQEFQGGWIVQNSRIGYRVLYNDMVERWGHWGREYGAIGLPITDRSVSGGLVVQQFDNASLVKATNGIRVLPDPVMELWGYWGQATGILGQPTGDPSVPGGSSYTQAFQGGTISVVNGAATVSSTVDPWWSARLSSPWLGDQKTNQLCTLTGGGCYQEFAGGWLVKNGNSAFALPNAVKNVWLGYGRDLGILGFPTGAPSANPTSGNYTQAFQGGVITVTSGAGAVTSATDPWWNARLTSTWLGGQTGNQFCTLSGGGCYQEFTGGWVVKSGAGAAALPNAVKDVWLGYGRDLGILGFPTGAPSANPTSGNYTQAFQGGVITVTNNVGAVTSATDPWWNARLTSTWLGAQTSNQFCTLSGGGCYQEFTGGWLVKSGAGAAALPNAVKNVWLGYGRDLGILGFPTSAPSANPTSGNYTQSFQGGVITVTNNVGAVTSATDPWWNARLTTAWLGSQTTGQFCNLSAGGCYQEFAGGWLVQSSAGAYPMPTAVKNIWLGYGRDLGILGFPTTGPSADPGTGNYTQTFRGGVITVAGGAASVTSATDPWWNARLTTAWLGAQTTSQFCNLAGGGCYQEFSGGWLVKSPAGVVAAVPSSVVQAWGWYGREQGTLGYPRSAPSANPTSGNYTQAFQGGTITVTNGAVTSIALSR